MDAPDELHCAVLTMAMSWYGEFDRDSLRGVATRRQGEVSPCKRSRVDAMITRVSTRPRDGWIDVGVWD
jgi:hypothetical protein